MAVSKAQAWPGSLRRIFGITGPGLGWPLGMRPVETSNAVQFPHVCCKNRVRLVQSNAWGEKPEPSQIIHATGNHQAAANKQCLAITIATTTTTLMTKAITPTASISSATTATTTATIK